MSNPPAAFLVRERCSSVGRGRAGWVVGVAIALALVASVPAGADPGDRDPTFGDGGLASIPQSSDAARALAVQPDGKIVTAGRRLVRFDADGMWDTSFGEGGVVPLVPPRFTSVARDVLVASDGRMLVPWAQYAPDGSLDFEFTHPWLDFAAAVALLPDGKIVAAGTTGEEIGLGPLDILVARFDGSLPDPTFGSGGATRLRLAPEADRLAVDMVVQPDGAIVVVGVSALENGAVVVRLTEHGTLDPSFGAGGVVVVPGTTNGGAVMLEADGRILVGGDRETLYDVHAAIARLLPDGELDPTFGSGGVATFPSVEGAVSVMVRQPDGKLLAAAGDLFRLDADDALDCTFGRAGVVRARYTAWARDLALLEDGRILTVGRGRDAEGTVVTAVVRYEGGDERLDPCGNCVVDPGEDCDDGNAEEFDACRGDCTANPCFGAPLGTPCDDGDPCTHGDACSRGRCYAPPVRCPLCEACGATGTCEPAVRDDCARSLEPTRSFLGIDQGADEARTRLAWHWRGGEQLPPAAFGTPTRGDAAALCVFDESATIPRLLFRLSTLSPGNCPRGLCWHAGGPGRYAYRRRSGDPDGIFSVRLRAGAAGRSSIALGARGPSLALPPLPLPFPLRLQLESEAGGCFTSQFERARRNDASQVRARGTQ